MNNDLLFEMLTGLSIVVVASPLWILAFLSVHALRTSLNPVGANAGAADDDASDSASDSASDDPTRDGEPRIVEEGVQYLLLLPSQYPAHLSALGFAPMESQQHRVRLNDYRNDYRGARDE